MSGFTALAVPAVAVRVGNKIVGVNENTCDDAEKVLCTSPEGTRIYKRSIAFLLGAAAFELKLGPVSIMESVGASFHFALPDCKMEVSTADFLNATMASLIARDLKIERKSIPRAEALKVFTEKSHPRSHKLIASSAAAEIDCHCCGDFMALAHNVLVSSTGAIAPAHCRVTVESEPFPHFRLHHAVPISATGEFELTSSHEPTLMEAYATRKNWGDRIDLQSAADVNKAITESRTKSVIQLSEALHDHTIVSIASNIAGAPGAVEVSGAAPKPRLVLIAGPSSSGKTTFAKRLGVALETLGARPVVLSVDCYYKAWQDIDSRGMQHVDWEALSSLNLDLLNDHLLELLEGKEVLVPEYDMKTSMPMSQEHWTKTRLPPGGIVVMEGIHCLNPGLTPRVPKQDKYQIMISPLSALVLDDLNYISSSQVRMLRRMVRDYLFRGRSAVGTLKQWPGVARGERHNIYPHQNNADVVMNSGLIYEANVLKVYAEPLLRSVTPELPEYAEARRLLSMLDHLVAMPAGTVPPQSLLCEFIGGSWFYDHGGMYKTA